MSRQRQTRLPRTASARLALLLMALAVPLLLAAPASAGAAEDCSSEDNEKRISGCTELLLQEGLDPNTAALAYSLRALAYSIKGQYDQAIPDYDRALALNPNFAVALNNRAWALFKSGRAEAGMNDVERSLVLSPGSPHALDTRAHIKQFTGRPAEAIADYDLAMRIGGEKIVKLYQCGLQSQGMYEGDIDGVLSDAVRAALKKCVMSGTCDPLPPDEECRRVTS
jgi:tetratricopeptide (TPR) repeat protein